MLISALEPRRLGVASERARLHFDSRDAGPQNGARHLHLAGSPAFELSFWCGTCPLLFERKEGANQTLSADLQPLTDLEVPLDSVDDRLVETFSRLLPHGEYLPLLLDVSPELVAPGEERDYFTHEQVATWGVDSFWELPENPRSYYYRTYETRVASDEHLYEFVVPMVPPGWNSRDRVQYYGERIREGLSPTAVALSTVDVCQPADAVERTDYYAHWGLTHFLLDGHHKMEAAARAGATIRLLALVSFDGSLAGADDIVRLPELLGRPRSSRVR